jgi:hypothetical protein
MNTLYREIGHLRWLLSFPGGLRRDLLEEVILSLVESLALKIRFLKESHQCGLQDRCNYNCEGRKERLRVEQILFWTVEFESSNLMRTTIYNRLSESGL